MAVSKDDFVRKLFPEATRTSEVNTKKLALISVSSKFRVGLVLYSPEQVSVSVDVYPILTTLWSCGVLHVIPYHSCIAFNFAGLTLFSSLPSFIS